MQRLSGFIGGIVVTVALLGTLVALGKSNNLLGQLQPVVIDIQQAVPIKAVVTIPGTDEKPVTTTLPLTVSVDLRVKVDSSKQVDIQVLGQPTPVVEVTSQNQNSQVDNQGPFAIKIGDKIGDGIPVAGAGRIETSGTEDVYIFTAEPNQEVYFDVQAYNATLNNDNTPYNDLYIGVYDEGNQEIFTRVLTQGDPGRYTLTKGGMYTVIIGNKTSDVTGAYKLQLWNAPADQFAISIGDTVADGKPQAGAGKIETPGAQDVYTFTAEPNQEVYFDVQAYNATLSNDNTPYNDLYIGVYDEGNQEIFTRALTQGDPGRYTLTKGGMYTVIIGNKTSDVTGSYKLQLWNAPADQFAISIGDTVADGEPQAGAGKIETPGAQDVYTFTAEPNQEVYFDVQAYNATLNNDSSPYNDLYIGVYDEDNQEIFTRALTQDDQRKYTLTKGGMYTIIIGNKTSDVTGSYKLQIRNGK